MSGVTVTQKRGDYGNRWNSSRMRPLSAKAGTMQGNWWHRSLSAADMAVLMRGWKRGEAEAPPDSLAVDDLQEL